MPFRLPSSCISATRLASSRFSIYSLARRTLHLRAFFELVLKRFIENLLSMETLGFIRHLVDFGMVVLIWLVQLIIYPSFLVIRKELLVQWHESYVRLMARIVGPLMIIQLVVVSIQTLTNSTATRVIALILVLTCWASSFLLSIPCHKRIGDGDTGNANLELLVRSNWPRSILWTAVFVLGFM